MTAVASLVTASVRTTLSGPMAGPAGYVPVILAILVLVWRELAAASDRASDARPIRLTASLLTIAAFLSVALRVWTLR